MATGEIKQRRAVWDFDPAIAIERQLQDVVSAVWNAVTYGVLAEDGDITATASELLPGVVEFAFQHARAGGRWGRLVVRRESEGVTLLCFVGPEFLQGNTPDEVARADLPAMRQWLRKRHDWRVGLWSYVVSEVMDRLQDEFKAVEATGSDAKSYRCSPQVRERFKLIRPLHEAHPGWTLQDIADELNSKLNKKQLRKVKRAGEELIADDVGNAWDAMRKEDPSIPLFKDGFDRLEEQRPKDWR